MPHTKRRGSLLILTAALFWSTGGFFIKSVSLDAFGISLWRSSLAALTLYLFYRLNFKSERKQYAPEWFSLRTLSTAIVYSALLVLFVMATKLTTSANAIFLQFTAPIYVLFFEPIISRTKIKLADICAIRLFIATARHSYIRLLMLSDRRSPVQSVRCISAPLVSSALLSSSPV